MLATQPTDLTTPSTLMICCFVTLATATSLIALLFTCAFCKKKHKEKPPIFRTAGEVTNALQQPSQPPTAAKEEPKIALPLSDRPSEAEELRRSSRKKRKEIKQTDSDYSTNESASESPNKVKYNYFKKTRQIRSSTPVGTVSKKKLHSVIYDDIDIVNKGIATSTTPKQLSWLRFTKELGVDKDQLRPHPMRKDRQLKNPKKKEAIRAKIREIGGWLREKGPGGTPKLKWVPGPFEKERMARKMAKGKTSRNDGEDIEPPSDRTARPPTPNATEPEQEPIEWEDDDDDIEL